MSEAATVFERAGGEPAFVALVERFYALVEDDELLRPIYPDDLEPGRTHLALFLMQYWGAGDVYSRRQGHPRLRMRHAEFPITPEVADRWATLMSRAIVEQGFEPEVEDALLRYVAMATPTLINQLPDGAEELPGSGAG